MRLAGLCHARLAACDGGTQAENARFLEALATAIKCVRLESISMHFGKVLMFGVGLIGASFARGLKAAKAADEMEVLVVRLKEA